MKTQQTHTPPPWKMAVENQGLENERFGFFTEKMEYIGPEMLWAKDSDFVLRAVNSHESLLEALKDARFRMSQMEWETAEDKDLILGDYDKAIAQAEGKQNEHLKM